MALIRCDFFSEALQLSTRMTVILPQETSSQIGMQGAAGHGRHPTLYLLHGLSDDDSIWLRRTSIERYVAPLGLAVVMPQVHRSFYADEVHGGRYWTFLSEELPDLAGRFFPLSPRREETFVAGLSMGGYGALKWALRQPDRFAAAASLSGVLDLAAVQRAKPLSDPVNRVFGGRSVTGTGDDLLQLLRSGDAESLPRLYVACGTSDELIHHNESFLAAARGAGVPVTTHLSPGEHEWSYWDREIQKVLAWIPLPRP